MSGRSSLVLALAAAAVLVPTLASAGTGDNIREGVRNPSGGAAAQRETQIIARTAKDVYGTRQSNLGAGGGAIYGCRSTLDVNAIGDPKKSTPCLRVNNLSDGKAFDLQSNTGRIVGVIQSGQVLTVPKPTVAPFVTNATAVAVGLNADRVDGLNASEIVTQAANAAAAAPGGSGTAACPANTTLAGGGCIETAPRAADDYADAAAACGAAGRRLVPPDVLLHARTIDGINLGGGEMSADLTVDAVTSVVVTTGITRGYTTVADNGTLDTDPLDTTAPFRCITG